MTKPAPVNEIFITGLLAGGVDLSDSAIMSSHTASPAPEIKRRDMLSLVATAGAVIGTAAVAWPFIDSMDPSKDVIAAGAPIDIDLTKIEAGQQVVVLWRGAPMLIVNRVPGALKTLQEPAMVARLLDPDSTVHQQPPYAENWHRSVKPEFAVLVGICTHLGCLPNYLPNPDPATPVENWPGGYFCPCHGSKYDLAGRVWSGVPAPYNLPVPPYRFVNDTTVRIGENPPGGTFELSSVVQM
jgi:ubiquinol-cytochrome c reductase iron-sulfur subunit